MSVSKKTKAVKPSLDFKGPIEGYVVNYATKNDWKVASTMERSELLSEAWLVYYKIAHRYPGVEAPHLMALFKTAWHRRFIELAAADSGSRKTFVPIRTLRGDDGEEYEAQEPAGDTENAGVLASLLRNAPKEVGLVMQLFLNAPQELLEVGLSTWQGPKEERPDGGSRRLNQLLGFDSSYDCIGAVRTYFEGTSV